MHCPIRKAKGGKRRYVPILPELAQELRTHLCDRTQGYLFETNRHGAFSSRRIQQLVKETAALAGISKQVSPHPAPASGPLSRADGAEGPGSRLQDGCFLPYWSLTVHPSNPD